MPKRRRPRGSPPLEPGQRASAAEIGRDARTAAVAGRQWGVVDHGQLLALGYSRSAVQRAVGAGRLHRRYQGVYTVGHTVLRREGGWLAAVLACGPGAALSHRSAAQLWDLRPSSRAPIDVTVTHRRLAPPGIDLHETCRLAGAEVTARGGVPVTTIARTLADLAAVVRPRDLERTLERAQAQHVLDVPSILASARHRPGAVLVRRILDAWEPSRTKSELEVALLGLVRRARLPEPSVNAHLEGLEVDLLWDEARLVAEADSVQFHLTRAAMERDRARDAVLARAGYRVLRFTDRQVHGRPDEVIAALRAALS